MFSKNGSMYYLRTYGVTYSYKQDKWLAKGYPRVYWHTEEDAFVAHLWWRFYQGRLKQKEIDNFVRAGGSVYRLPRLS